jgi:GNAT superfamily N-acetyltransferase
MFGPIDRLTPADLPDCVALGLDRRWPREERKWQMLFAVGSVYGVRDDAGDLAAVVVLTCFDGELAVIGMMVVATRYGRRGLGRALMTHVLAEAGDATVLLNATEAGRPLYEKLGFEAAGMIYSYAGDFGPAPGVPGSRPATPGDLSEIRALDAQANGADRAYLVRRLPGFSEALRVVEHRGAVTGYAGAWRNIDNAVIGPVIAASPDDAATLIADVACAVTGPVRVDLGDRHPRLREWVTGRGLALRDSETVMVLGGRPLPGDRARWFAPFMQALG